MDEILRQHLLGERGHSLYYNIEEQFGLHLGVADKFLLLSHLMEKRFDSFDDLWVGTYDFLWNMGYRSKKFEDRIRDIREYEQDIAAYALAEWRHGKDKDLN